MTNEEVVALALALGAAARVRPNNWAQKWPEVAEYQELLDLLARSYGGVNASMMEPAPGSEDRRTLLAQQLRQTGAADSRAVLKQSRRVLREVLARSPQSLDSVLVDEATVTEALLTIENSLEPTQHTRAGIKP